VGLHLKFLDHRNIFPSKDNSLYIVALENEGKSKHSRPHSLEELLGSELHITVPVGSCNISFVERIGQKDVLRFKIVLSEEDLLITETSWVTKSIVDAKNRAIGVVEFQMKRSLKPSKSTLNTVLN
jgi:hypothetical protein